MKNQTGINSDTALAVVVTHALRNGFDVFIPFSEGTKVDLIITSFNGQSYRLQVKKAYINCQRNKYYAQVMWVTHANGSDVNKRKRGTYSKQDIDIMAIADIDNNHVWLIPIEYLAGYKSSISLETNKFERFKNNWGLISTSLDAF